MFSGVNSLSFTGGEPLLQADFIKNLLPKLRAVGDKPLEIHLETNGTLPEALKKVLKYVDFISMDIKLSSVTGQPTKWKKHLSFLRLAKEKPLQVKIVVGKNTGAGEILKAAKLIKRVDKNIVLILQPETGRNGKITIGQRNLLKLYLQAVSILPRVLVLPQMHKLLGIL